jgi:hypothetical protein
MLIVLIDKDDNTDRLHKSKGHLEVVKLLLQNGANINDKVRKTINIKEEGREMNRERERERERSCFPFIFFFSFL